MYYVHKPVGNIVFGQILRRIKDRLHEILIDVDQAKKDEPFGLHFSCTAHEAKDLDVPYTTLKSTQALSIKTGNNVVKIWIHLFRTQSP